MPGHKRWFFLFVLPTAAAYGAVFVIPFLVGVWLSFCEFVSVADARFVGVSNYVRAFSNDDFIRALLFTLRYAAVTVVIVVVCAFALALALRRGTRWCTTLRAAFFLPNLIGGIVLGYIWQLILNGILGRFGVDLTYDASYGFWGLVAVTSWQLVGYMMMIFIAALGTIPEEVEEAARIDGAAWGTMLWRIKVPLVRPAIAITTFLTLSNALKTFDANLALTAGAPGRETAALALDIYQTFYGRVGYEGVGQAKAVVFFLLAGAITLGQLWVTRERG